MKENRIAIIIMIFMAVISLVMSIIIEYIEKANDWFINPDFIISCMLGLFSGAFLALLIAIINYNIIKKSKCVEFINLMNCLCLKLMPIYNIFKPEASREYKYCIEIIMDVYDYLLSNYHMKSCEIEFLFRKSKSNEIIDSSMEMINELYQKVLNIKLDIHKYEFQIITEEELIEKIDELLIYLRNYGSDKNLYTNVLSTKQNDLQNKLNIEFDYKGRADI